MPDAPTAPVHPAPRTQRPRVEGGREQEILVATLDLLLDVGYDRLTLDAVAARARASKATLYRRWAGKADLVVDAVVRLKGWALDTPDTGNLRSDLQMMISGQPVEGLTEESLNVLCAVSTAAHRDPALRSALIDRFIGPPHRLLRGILQRALERGEIRADADLDLIADVAPAMLLYRASFGEDRPTEEIFAEVIEQIVLPSVRPNTG